ncbi:MAG TPA: IclR family transcriptional regulator [Micromonosporaceae bacterium]|nr:IclR family transcriptional regulator [Micromonosporaceae bacterium]
MNTSGLRRDLELLDALAMPEAVSRGGLGVVRLAELTGRDKSQVSRALAALAEAGLVERDPTTQAFQLGWRLYALAAVTREAYLVRAAAPYLRRLVAQVHETAHLCVLRGDAVLTVLSESPQHAFRGLGWEGVHVPALRTAAGRALVSDWEPGVLASRFSDGTLAEGNHRLRLRDQADLMADIEHIRQNGYAKVAEELEEGLVDTAAPVRDHTRRIVAAITIAGPKGRLGDRLDEIGRLTAEVADELSVALGRPDSTLSPARRR